MVVELPPPEEGIQRFEYSTDEVGPLGLKFSGGFPPLILDVKAGSPAEKKGIPVNFEVHAINGLALVPQNKVGVMECLKTRPVILDVRPQGWKPKEMVRERERIRERKEAEEKALIEKESQRREQVAREQKEEEERQAAERAERKEREVRQQEDALRRAREVRAQQKAKLDEWEHALAMDPLPLRSAASGLMAADYGTDVRIEGRRGLPLRLMTRQKEVAWIWAGEAMELIGGGAPDAADTWST